MNQATISRNGHMPTNFVTQNPYNQNHAYNQQQQYNSYTPSNNSTPMSLPRNSQYNSPYAWLKNFSRICFLNILNKIFFKPMCIFSLQIAIAHPGVQGK